MNFLKNFKKCNLYIDIESNRRFINDSNLSCIGLFEEIGNNLSQLYVKDSNLYFSIKDELQLIDDRVFSKLKTISQINKNVIRRRFSLLSKNKIFKDQLLLTFEYYAEIGYNTPPFDYIDTEDSDWGLFVQNIINNKRRKENFISYNSILK